MISTSPAVEVVASIVGHLGMLAPTAACNSAVSLVMDFLGRFGT